MPIIKKPFTLSPLNDNPVVMTANGDALNISGSNQGLNQSVVVETKVGQSFTIRKDVWKKFRGISYTTYK